MALPTTECVRGQPLQDKVDSIYCAVRDSAANAGADVGSLESCECVKNESLGGKLDDIYSALYAWTLAL